MNILEIMFNSGYHRFLGCTLLVVSAILSAMFTEVWLKNKKINIIVHILICLSVFVLNIGITLLLLWGWLEIYPQKDSFAVLVKKVADSYLEDFLLPLFAAVIAGWAVNSKQMEKRWVRRLSGVLLCCLLLLSSISSSVLFFWNSFKMIERPQYAFPIEAISSVINSRMDVYPFLVSGNELRNIGNGAELISTESGEASTDSMGQEETYEEPSDFTGYMNAIRTRTFAPGMDSEDYLQKAYALFVAGEYNDDFYNIGYMWYCLYFLDNPPVSEEECLQEALLAYQKYEEINGDSAHGCCSIGMIYNLMGERGLVREYMRKSLELDNEVALEYYADYIYDWVDDENRDLLMEDAAAIMNHGKYLSMYILYGVCAVTDNCNVENAYTQLCAADEYFQGRSAMVKILRCICADLIGIDESSSLYDIYSLEEEHGLTEMEEAYLMRYLLSTNRYDELLGYVNDVAQADSAGLDIEKAAIMSVWYFKNMDRVEKDKEDIVVLLELIDEKLDGGMSDAEESNLALMSQALLKYCLGETEGSEIYTYEIQEGVSAIEYVFGATSAFNAREYEDAIRFCEMFFDAEKGQEEGADAFPSLENLNAQEEMMLHYHIQLIYAHAHFEYAKDLGIETEQGLVHMEIAEQECDVFEHSSKGLFYIGEKFQNLKNYIYEETGRLPEDFGDEPMMYEVD